jgi:class 3 adenylate cyclase/tetratricopeptide (TPR) repeat protein
VSPGARFCKKCGTAIGPHKAAASATLSSPKSEIIAAADGATSETVEGERKTVTVLFADLKGSTTLMEDLDPEEARAIVDPALRLMMDAVHRYDGYIVQSTGDGVFALFGAPVAHEDHPQRALYAALRMQEDLRRYSDRLRAGGGLPIQARAGVNTGEVVVRSITTGEGHTEYTPIGHTANLASRMQTLAPVGSVAVTEATRKLCEGYFQLRGLGPMTVKGLSAPINVYEVIGLGPRGRRARLDLAVERGLTPLVGRDRPLATLGELLTEVKAGNGQVVFVSGEAGIGKSRLLLEFRRLLAAGNEEVTWLEGRCVSFGASIPMLPTLDQLRENFHIEVSDGEPEIIAKVEHGMRRLGGLDAEIPYIRYLLAVDPGDPGVLAMDAGARRTRIFHGLRALALRGAGRRPLVLVVEDMHWADSSTQEYLDFFMDSVAGARLMLILTYRLGYTPSFGTRSFHSTINLRHLTNEQTIEMAARFLGGELFPEELKSALMQKAEGVPLFVEEVTKTLLDLGFITRENGKYRMAKAVSELAIPETIQGIIMARLDRLGEDGKRTVQLASVIGRQFLVRLLERVAGLTGKLEGLLRELKALEIIYEQGMIPEPAYVFKHAVIQDVAYSSLLLQRRKELHRAVGAAIEELYRDRLAEHYAELAYHFGRGEDWSRVMEYGRLAGDQCSHSFANAEAIEHYTHAIDAAAKLPVTASGAVGDLHASSGGVLSVIGRHQEAFDEYARAVDCARSAKDNARECRFLLALSWAQFNAHQIRPMLDTCERSRALAKELGDVAIQASSTVASALGKGVCEGATPEIIEQAEEAVRLAETLTEPRPLAQTTVLLGQLLQWHGEFERALGHLHKGLKLAREAHSDFVFGQGLFSLGNLSLSRGEYEQALDWYRQLNDYAQAAGDAFWLARIPNCAGAVSLELYELERALELQLEGDEAGRKYSPWPEPRGHSLLKAGLAHWERTDYGRAEEFFLRAWALLETDDVSRYRWHMPLLYARGALALARGRHDEAWRFATQSLELARKTYSRKHEAPAQRLQGEILAATGRLRESAPLLESSVTLARGLTVPRDEWLAAFALGKLLIRVGKDTEAEVAFNTAAAAIESIAAGLKTDRSYSQFCSRALCPRSI